MANKKYIDTWLKQAEINKGSRLTSYEIAETIRYLKNGLKTSFSQDYKKKRRKK